MALAALSLDHSAVIQRVDEAPLGPGASVATYETSTPESAARLPAPTAQSLFDGDLLEPRASVASYGD